MPKRETPHFRVWIVWFQPKDYDELTSVLAICTGPRTASKVRRDFNRVNGWGLQDMPITTMYVNEWETK